MTGIEVWLTVIRSWLGLRFWPERELTRAFAPPANPTRSADRASIDAFKRATRSIATGRCLLLSVAMSRFLRRRGIAATVRVGFDTKAKNMSGHAWVVCGGEVLGDAATIDRCFRHFNVTAAGLAEFLTCRRAAVHIPEKSLEF
jgi:Transglutaminase-like superfamily